MGRPRTRLQPHKVHGNKFNVQHVPISEIEFDNEFNCRGVFTYESVAQLAEGIEEYGLQFPVVLWPRDDLPGGKKYKLIAGFRRLRAFELLKQDTIPGFVRDDLTQRLAEVINLIENLERQDLNPLQEAQAVRNLYPEGASLRTIAKELNQSERWVHSRLRIMDLPHDVQLMIAAGRIKLTYITRLWKLQEKEGAIATLAAAKALSGEKKKGWDFNKIPAHLRSRQDRAKIKRPTKKEVIEMLIVLLDATIIGLAPRVGAYCAGYISKEELLTDIKKSSKRRRPS